MTHPDRTSDLAAALAAVRAAAAASRSVQHEVLHSAGAKTDKQDRSPVTIADFAAQALVGHALRGHDPHTPLVGEEDAELLRQAGNSHLRDRVVDEVLRVTGDIADGPTVLQWIDHGNGEPNGERFWTLDPIDGTKGFLRGGQYAIALALIENGQPVLGVLGCPAYELDTNRPEDRPRGLLFSAVAGGGAAEHFLGSHPSHDPGPPRTVHVAEVSGAAATRFCESMESGHSDQDTSVRIAQELGIGTTPIRLDSQAKYAAVARGDAGIYLRLPTRKDYRERIWDHAAGMLLVMEAGGRVSDVDGKPLDFSQGTRLEANRGVVASTASIHDEVLAAVGKHVPEA